MSALTGNDVLARVQRQFGDESGVQVTPEDVARWIIDACNEAALQHENLQPEAVFVATVAGQNEYNLVTSTFAVQSVYYRVSESDQFYALRYLSLEQFDEYAQGHDYGSGNPEVYTRGWDKNTLRVFPAPDTSSSTLLKVALNTYIEFVNMESQLPLPQYYSNYVIEYCLMKAYEMDEDWQAAATKAEYVQSTLDANNNRESWFGRATYPTVVVSAEDAW